MKEPGSLLTATPWDTKNLSSRQGVESSRDDQAHAAFVKSIIFLTLGVTLSLFALNNWDSRQLLTLISGMAGVMLGLRNLANIIQAATRE